MANTALVTLFTGALTVLAHRQWKTMTAQSESMKAQLAEMKSGSEDTRRIAEAAQKSADAAAGALEITRLLERPWITASISAHTHFAFDNDDGTAWVTLWLNLENTGRSAATNIRHRIELTPMFHVDHGSYRSIQDRLTNEITHDQTGQALLPGESSRSLCYCAAAKEAFERIFILRDGGGEYTSMIIVGVVAYRFATSSDEHTTRFAYHVGKYERGIAAIVVRLGETLPPGEIEFLREPYGSYAD
jgi:hypothetical protein